MAESTGHNAMTIARFLAEVSRGVLELSPSLLVVVDEASMVDLSRLHRLLRIIPAGARALLVGDETQLPPIGFGLAFHRLVSSSTVPVARLLVVHRQAPQSSICRL